MKRLWTLFAVALMFLVPSGLSGCGTKEKAPETKTVAPEKKEAAAAEKPAADKPATDKPKDHPAH